MQWFLNSTQAFRVGWVCWKKDRRFILAVRAFVYQALPRSGFEVVRFTWWCLSSYGPRLIASLFVRRLPEVRSFSSDGALNLARQIRAVNLLAPTKMCLVMTKYGSDKAQRWHNYTPVYSALLKRYRDRPVRILELGLGTNNPELRSSMGVDGRPGASLRGWRELFPRALVYGADIDRNILFQENRIKTFYCDQLDQAAIRELWSQPDLQGGVDIIVEDGLHTFEANISFLEGSLEHLRPGGMYVIEDIVQDTAEKWHDQLETVYSRRYPTLEFAFVALPNDSNHYDNNLLIIRRSAQADTSSAASGLNSSLATASSLTASL